MTKPILTVRPGTPSPSAKRASSAIQKAHEDFEKHFGKKQSSPDPIPVQHTD